MRDIPFNIEQKGGMNMIMDRALYKLPFGKRALVTGIIVTTAGLTIREILRLPDTFTKELVGGLGLFIVVFFSAMCLATCWRRPSPQND